MAIGDGYIPFREIYVHFHKLFVAEFFHSPPSKLNNISVNGKPCNLCTVLRFGVTSKGKLKLVGLLPDSATRLETEEITLRPRPSMSAPERTKDASRTKDKKEKKESNAEEVRAATLAELITAMKTSMEEAKYVEPSMGVPVKSRP